MADSRYPCYGQYTRDPRTAIQRDCTSCDDAVKCISTTRAAAALRGEEITVPVPAFVEVNDDDGWAEEEVTLFQRPDALVHLRPAPDVQVSDGSTARYYELPTGAAELQDLIAHRDMNAQLGEIFRACYRYGQVSHSPKMRDIKKIIYYAQAELARLEKLEKMTWP